VDELPRGKRQPFFEALQQLVADFPDAIYITTSRPAGLKDENGEEWTEWEDWMRAEKFSNCVMEPMNLLEIEQFVKRWHEALPPSSQNENKDPDQTAQDLMRQIRQTPEIRQLASTPLLCTMICTLHYTNEGTLPSTRIRLYQQCIEMLLEERDKQRGIVTSIALTMEQKEGFLQSLAYWLISNGYSDAELEQVDQKFQDGILRYGLKGIEGKDIRQLLLERSGLLRELIVGRVDFIHRTFQEYLAAKAILKNNNIGLLTKNIGDDQWRETVIVAVGNGSIKEQTKILTTLLDKGEKNSRKRHYLHFLAVACLETGIEIDPGLRTRIEDAARALLPPKTQEEVGPIARAGESVVHLLDYDSNYSYEQIAYCIQVLVQIGSNTAMKMLINYAKTAFDEKDDSFQEIARALGEGYFIFDREEYVRQIFYHLDHLNLTGTQVKDLGPLTQLVNLQSLDLRGTQIQNLSPLSQLSNLQSLDLSGTQIQDLSPLSQLSNLQSLNLRRTQVQDLSPLTQLTNLQELYLSGTQIQGLSPLSQLTNLQELYLSGTEVQDLSPLTQLTNLQKLFLSKTQVQDLSQLTNLQELCLSGTEVQDLSPLTQLTNLQKLYLIGTQVQDLSPLTQLTNLQELYLSDSKRKIAKSLKDMKNLRIMFL
jgi:Leucine Rich repeats (2 copies)